MTRIVARQLAKTIRDALGPLQLCVGVPSGAEMAGRLAQLAFDSDKVVASVDIRNAFNTVRRGSIMKGVLQHAPSLAQYFKAFYGARADLLLSSGERVGYSCIGVRQGDPLGMILFSLGFHACLEAIDARTKEIAEDTPSAVWAFADDLQICGDGATVAAVLQDVSNIMGSYRLEIVTAKSMVVAQSGPDQDGYYDPFPFTDSGCKIVGCPVGTDDYRTAELQAWAQHQQTSFTALRCLTDRQVEYSLLSQCVAQRPLFLCRVLPYALTKTVMTAFDTAVDNSLAHILQVEVLPEHVKVLREIPLRLGWLGIPRYGSERGEIAFISCSQLTLTVSHICRI